MATDFQYRVTAAGRVNIIGEHVDYCGGKVFPAALSLKNTVYVRANGTNTIRLSWTTIPDKLELDINKLESYKAVKYANYPAGSAFIWQKLGHKVIGCDMLFECTVPFGSGLSSSAAIEVSTIAALCVVSGEEINNVDIALAAQRAECEYVGMNCGIMDQYASACGKQGYAMLLDCKTLKCDQIPLTLGSYTLVIANTNKPHSLVESKYNERRAETEEALRLLKGKLDVSCLADVTPAAFAEHKGLLPQPVQARAQHVVEECERVHAAAVAMRSGDVAELGRLLSASHRSLQTLYEVTGRELDTLAEAAQAHPACVGARMTGAGFGGCIVAIVEKEHVADFQAKVAQAYKEKIGYDASFYPATVEDGITITKLQGK